MSRRPLVFLIAFGLLGGAGCASVPEDSHSEYGFPKKDVFVGIPKRRYKRVGVVRSKVNFPTLQLDSEIGPLCKNYYNRAAQKLLKYAKEKGADAVVNVRSVVFLMDGRSETYKSAECADDGKEGQVLAQGLAIKWLKSKKEKRSSRK